MLLCKIIYININHPIGIKLTLSIVRLIEKKDIRRHGLVRTKLVAKLAHVSGRQSDFST